MLVNLLKVRVLFVSTFTCKCMYKVYIFFFSTACAVGTYGLECRETCGNCRDVSQCLKTNGACLGGCKDGFQGILCKSREELNHTIRKFTQEF